MTVLYHHMAFCQLVESWVKCHLLTNQITAYKNKHWNPTTLLGLKFKLENEFQVQCLLPLLPDVGPFLVNTDITAPPRTTVIAPSTSTGLSHIVEIKIYKHIQRKVLLDKKKWIRSREILKTGLQNEVY